MRGPGSSSVRASDLGLGGGGGWSKCRYINLISQSLITSTLSSAAGQQSSTMASSAALARFFLLLAVYGFTSVFAAFGYTKSGTNYVIDAGSANALVFSVSSASCDINSIKYRGTELQYSGKGSHISSGLGTATVSVSQTTSYIKVTCVTSTLTHYMVVKSGEASIYMADYITAEPAIGELRFVARLLPSVLPSEHPYGTASTTAGGTAIEGSDVYLVSGQTRSKFYSSTRFIDENVHCVYGTSTPEPVHACIMTPQQESSSGGPFFRDIDTNNAGDSTNLYNYMNSGHVQTETFRTGLHGPYVMAFSRDGVPAVKSVDTSFFGDLGITGYVAASGRGTVAGTASGVGGAFQPVVHWYNGAAQYWTVASSSSGAFTSPAMKPGTYTMVLYQTEFKVASQSVTVAAGKATAANIASTLEAPTTSLFKIGEYDGQPTGFMNADKIQRMHPSDGRMTAWKAATYTVGSSALDTFPMAIFQTVNNPVTIAFTLEAAPSGAATLRIATTLSFASSRPQAKVNSWTATAPAAPTKIDSRGVTRGAYRGFGEVYDVTVPAGTLVAGSNTITITSLSGSSGDTYLNPNFIFDCVELFQ